MFFFNDTATTEIYTLSLHDALPIWHPGDLDRRADRGAGRGRSLRAGLRERADLGAAGLHGIPVDRKSTRLNSSHANISYAVFCLKKQIATRFLILCRVSSTLARRHL